MLFPLLVMLALVIIIVRSLYRAVKALQGAHKHWLEILFDLSVAIVAIYFFTLHFGEIL